MINFEDPGCCLKGLIGLVILNFLQIYFSGFPYMSPDCIIYFQCHTVMMMVWIFLLIFQSSLLRKDKFKLYKSVEILSYLVFPYLIISAIFLAHNSHSIKEDNLDMALFVPFKDILLLVTFYFIAIIYRKVPEVYKSAMLATGFIFIEPTLVKIISSTIVPYHAAYFIVMVVLYSLLILLIVKESSQKKGRWVFPLVLGLYVIAHCIIVFEIHAPFLESASRWFIKLPLT